MCAHYLKRIKKKIHLIVHVSVLKGVWDLLACQNNANVSMFLEYLSISKVFKTEAGSLNYCTVSLEVDFVMPVLITPSDCSFHTESWNFFQVSNISESFVHWWILLLHCFCCLYACWKRFSACLIFCFFFLHRYSTLMEIACVQLPYIKNLLYFQYSSWIPIYS